MKVDIWSDIRCPFCYIGKRRFENALDNFDHKNEVEITWHSFQLDPNLKTQPETDSLEFFSKIKGMSPEQARQMFEGAQEMAAGTGLKMNLEDTVVANSYRSHQLLQFAKTRGKANEIKEALFKAHFENSKNIDDLEVLKDIASTCGLDPAETERAITSKEFEPNVNQDEEIARKIGVQGVPFFVFNNKYAVSGAQPEESFLQVLSRVWEEDIQESATKATGDS